MIVELPHHKGGLGITPLPARAWQRFTARLLKWFVGWVRSLTPPNGFLIRILQIPTLGTALPPSNPLLDNLLTHYNYTEWAPPLVADAPAPDAPAQGRDDDSARPVSLPLLNLLASLRVRQDVDNGEVAARPSLPPQRQVTKHIESSQTPNPLSLPALKFSNETRMAWVAMAGSWSARGGWRGSVVHGVSGFYDC